MRESSWFQLINSILERKYQGTLHLNANSFKKEDRFSFPPLSLFYRNRLSILFPFIHTPSTQQLANTPCLSPILQLGGWLDGWASEWVSRRVNGATKYIAVLCRFDTSTGELFCALGEEEGKGGCCRTCPSFLLLLLLLFLHLIQGLL